MKTEVQKTHFNLGTSKLDYVSYAGGTMIEHPITKEAVIANDKNRRKAIEDMRNANFRIPTEQVLRTGQSMYKAAISDATAENQLAGPKAQLLTNLKEASVQVGRKGSKLDSTTEQAEQYIHPEVNRKSDVSENAKMRNYLKGHHFELGSNNKLSLNVNGPHSVLTAPMTGTNHYLS